MEDDYVPDDLSLTPPKVAPTGAEVAGQKEVEPPRRLGMGRGMWLMLKKIIAWS